MRLEVTHLGNGARADVIAEMCCATMSEVISNGTVGNNNDFADAYSADYSPFNIFSYEDNSIKGFYPLHFCPFCGKKIEIEFIDGRPTTQE